MTQANTPDDQIIIDAGYTPRLKRGLGFISSFAVSFSFMSVLACLYSNYSYALGKGGPFSMWTWPIVGLGQFLVALTLAETAGRLPLTGALYNWNNRLFNPTIGFVVGWIMALAYSIGAIGILVAMFAPLQTLLGVSFSQQELNLIGVGVIISHLLINIYGVKLAARLNLAATFSEIIAIIGFGVVLAAIALVKGEVHTELLAHPPVTDQSYWSQFMLAGLLGAWTMIGFEAQSDLSEETLNVKRVSPKSMITAFLATFGLGFFLILVLTTTIPDVAATTSAADPISSIVSHYLGLTATRILLVLVVLAIYANTLLGIAVSPRLLFAMARDKRLPFSTQLSRVSAHSVPKNAAYVVAAIELAFFLFCRNATDLYASCTILYTLVYLITVIGFALQSRKLPVNAHFTLGKFHWPVTILAALWLVFEIGVLTVPDEFHTAAFIAVGVVFTGVALRFIIDRQTRSP